MKCKAVIFDLDGTLLDTLADLADSMNEVLAHHNFAVQPGEKYKYFVGDGVEMLVRRATEGQDLEENRVAELAKEFHRAYDNHWDAKTTLYPGIAALLSYLTDANIPKAVLSNKPHQFTCLCVNRFLESWSFAQVVGVSSETPKKPNPKGALRIAEQLGVLPHEIFYVGDTNTDMETAKRAGMQSVGVLWGFRGQDELVQSGARWVVRTPNELIELIAEHA